MARRNRLRRPRLRRARLRRVPRGLSTGGFTISRRIPTCYITNSNEVGIPIAVQPPAGVNLLQVGAPVVNPVFGGVYTVPFALQFTLDQLAGYTDISQIADKYKIVKANVRVMYNATAVQGSNVAAQYPSFAPSVTWVPDHDDFAVPTPIQLQQRMGLRTKALTRGYANINVSPRCASVAFNAGIVPAYSVPSKPQWVNSTYTSVPHYGLKGYIENMSLQANSGATSAVTFIVTLTVKARELQ